MWARLSRRRHCGGGGQVRVNSAPTSWQRPALIWGPSRDAALYNLIDRCQVAREQRQGSSKLLSDSTQDAKKEHRHRRTAKGTNQFPYQTGWVQPLG